MVSKEIKKPLISIIINCFNGQQFLKDALMSVVNQTYKNWEIIFWDNQSRDKSKKIFLDFKDKRFKHRGFAILCWARGLRSSKSKAPY